MIEALSTRTNKIRTFLLLGVCGLSAITSGIVGIDDNPPGVLLAFLAAVALVLAFCHPWRTARKFMVLLLASVLGFLLFVILSILTDSILQNPASPVTLQKLIENPVSDALALAFTMICSAALVVGAIGSLVLFLRNRHQGQMKV